MRFEQRQEQVIRVAPDQDGLTVIVANDLASTDKRFCNPFDGAPARLLFKPVGGYFLSFLPGARERRVCLPELVNTSPAGVRDSDCGVTLPVLARASKKRPCLSLVSLSLFMRVLSQFDRLSGGWRG